MSERNVPQDGEDEDEPEQLPGRADAPFLEDDPDWTYWRPEAKRLPSDEEDE